MCVKFHVNSRTASVRDVNSCLWRALFATRITEQIFLRNYINIDLETSVVV